MQTSMWNGGPPNRVRIRLLGGIFVLLAIVVTVLWSYGARSSMSSAVQGEPQEMNARNSAPARVQWARGSRPPENANISAAPAIRGVVLDVDGSTLEGVAVVAKDYQVAGNLPISVSSTQSDKQGRFELPVREGAYYIHANKDGYGPVYVSAKSGEAVSLIMRKAGVLEGHVRDERGAPVAHFTLDLVFATTEDTPALAPLWSGTFDKPDGSFRIAEMPPLGVVVRASAAGYAPTFSKRIRMGPGEQRSIELTLSPGCTVEGTVATRSGQPLPEVFLDAEQRRTAGFLTEGAVDATSQTKSDAAGHFRLTNVPKGNIVVRAYDGVHAVTTANLEIADCAGIQPLPIVMSDGGSIVGVVRADDGAPVASALLTLTHRTIGFVHAVSDAEGRFRFDQVPPALVPVEVQHAGRRTQVRVQAREDEVVERDIKLPPAGTGAVTGRVTIGSRPLGGVVVEALAYAKKTKTSLKTTTAEDGSYHLTDVPAGNYFVKVPSAFTRGRAEVKGNEVVTVNLAVTEATQSHASEE